MGTIPDACSSTYIADVMASIERLDDANLLKVRSETDRICRQRGIREASQRQHNLMMLGSVRLGATFVYRTVEILGEGYANSRKPSFEGLILKVIGFRPRNVNQIIVEEPSGCQCVLPLWLVEKGLRLMSKEVSNGAADCSQRNDA